MRAAILLLIFLWSSVADAAWRETTITGVPTRSNRQITAVFINTYTGNGIDQYPQDQWIEVDISKYVPPDTAAVFLSGQLIITHGREFELCNLTVAFRAPGDSTDSYHGQALEAHQGGGVRTPYSTFVPVVGGKFEFKWNRSTSPNWPEHCSYGVNLNLQAYFR